LTFRPEQLLSK